MLPANSTAVTAFSLQANATAAVNISTSKNAKGPVVTIQIQPATGFSLGVLDSVVGNIDVSLLNTVGNAVLQTIVIPFANREMKDGLPLPSVEGVSFLNTATSLVGGHIQISTDINYKPTHVYEEQGQCLSSAGNSTCPAGEKVCNYLPNKYQCCFSGESCIPNVGCRCFKEKLCLKKQQALKQRARFVTGAAAAPPTCPASELLCNYLPNKYQCCFSGEQCIKNVGCRCFEEKLCLKKQHERALAAGNSTCPAGEKVCNYLPNKTACCFSGESCIPNVGCRC